MNKKFMLSQRHHLNPMEIVEIQNLQIKFSLESIKEAHNNDEMTNDNFNVMEQEGKFILNTLFPKLQPKFTTWHIIHFQATTQGLSCYECFLFYSLLSHLYQYPIIF
jgi:hypothetical protein